MKARHCMRISLWSSPRNVSTALMYAFAQRSDTRVVDEPLYGHYLRVTGADHPQARKVMESMDCDGERVVRDVILGPCDRPVLFFKNMTHHLVQLDRGFLRKTTNVILTRDPGDMVPSLAAVLKKPALKDTGFPQQTELLGQLEAMGQDPPVLESRELLRNPRSVLEQLCERLGLSFRDDMLHWPAGPKPCDGVWAPHWYANVHRSTGFAPYRARTTPAPRRLQDLIAACRPHYAELAARAIRAEPQENVS